MKQSLQLRLGQQLTMTPQLQQAIRMLQLSTLELQMEIQQALDSNLMLEEAEEDDSTEDWDSEREELTATNAAEQLAEQRAEDHNDDASHGDDSYGEHSLDSEAMPDELPVDSVWDDIYEPPLATHAAAEDDREFEHGDTSSDSLREHLLWQMQMAQLSPTDRDIAEAIIDAVGDDGLLATTLDDLLEGLQQDDPEIEMDEVIAVLHTVQHFDPTGVAARDLRECLCLQCRALPEQTPWRNEALRLLDKHFDLLAGRDYTQLKRQMKLDDEGLGQITRLIQSLNPRPGGMISNDRIEYIVPDVFVRPYKGTWRVELNPEASPRLRINHHYASLMRQMNSDDSTTLKNHLQEARWFIKSLQSRNETLLRVATSIVEHQREFLEQGEVGMKPMILHDIAEELGMHESTISRTTTRKYMHTPRGVFELKYFFSSHVGTASGGEASSTAIRAMIKKLIADEAPNKPLSDNKIASILSADGINIARRTVAKYREAMAIPPSSERKRLV